MEDKEGLERKRRMMGGSCHDVGNKKLHSNIFDKAQHLRSITESELTSLGSVPCESQNYKLYI